MPQVAQPPIPYTRTEVHPPLIQRTVLLFPYPHSQPEESLAKCVRSHSNLLFSFANQVQSYRMNGVRNKLVKFEKSGRLVELNLSYSQK